ncbi:MAG: hypothetical protein U0903_20710 [Planctomycetales bacterium]
MVKTTGIDPILKYLASDQAEEVDTQIVDSLRNFLSTSPGTERSGIAGISSSGGITGLADYNTTRAAHGLPKVTVSHRSRPDAQMQQERCSSSTGRWITSTCGGGLAEQHAGFERRADVPEDYRGPIPANSRAGTGSGPEYVQRCGSDKLNHTTLADIIKNNTTTTNPQSNVFFLQRRGFQQVLGDGNKGMGTNRRSAWRTPDPH